MKLNPYHVFFFVLHLAILVNACQPQQWSSHPLPDDAVVLALGDSLTVGVGAEAEDSYPSQLAELTGWRVISEAVSGHKSSDLLSRLESALDRPRIDLILLLIGGNDFLKKRPEAETRRNIRNIIRTIQAKHIPVVMIAVPKPGILLRPHPLYEEIAEELQVPVIKDLLAELLSDRSLHSDAVHLNAQGYRRLAQGVAEHLVAFGFLREIKNQAR